MDFALLHIKVPESAGKLFAAPLLIVVCFLEFGIMIRSYLIAAALAAQALAAPRPQPAIIPRPHRVEAVAARAESGSPPEFAIEDTPTQLPSGPAGASGSLRGPTSLLGYSPGNPVNTQLPATVPKDQFQLAPAQSEDADLGLYLDLSAIDNPQPIRGGTDAPTDPGPRNRELEKQNSDLYAPPGTDAGDVPNAKWPLGTSQKPQMTLLDRC